MVMVPAVPATIGKYSIEREIGRGASSTVYLGFDRFMRRAVAIKQIHPHLLADPGLARRYRKALRNEAAMAGQLNHPHIVRLLDLDEDAEPPYLVLEYVDGKSLASFTQADHLLPLAQVMDIAFKVCGALEHAHRKGLVHRDIKPANILLQADGEPKVADFGTALSVHSDTTQLAGLVGSPAYMSPEQVKEQPCTQRSDIFSLGIVLYQLVTGRNPFEGDTNYATLYRISHEQPPPPSVLRPELSLTVDRLIMRALAKRPQKRFLRWADFADAILTVSRAVPETRVQDRQAEQFARMRALPFFADFDDAALWETLRLGTLHAFPRDAVLIREGARGESFYVILEGTAAVRHHTLTLSVLSPGVTLGEMAYLQPEHPVRTATAVATSAILALEIRNSALRQASESVQTCFGRAFIKLLVERLISTSAQVGHQEPTRDQVH
jgi:eukaryotic-like serine/threonine-protein kinase